MDNLTHSLVGLAAAKAGLERTSPHATFLCILAANAPDADIVTLVGGPWTYLEHHRGITHSIAGTLGLALLLPALLTAGDHVVARLRRRPPRARFRGLLLASLILSASHPLLDWTNSYGVRPFLPWDAQWFYGDLVFILDPWLWLSLGGASFLLTSKKSWQVAAWTVLAVAITAAILFLPQTRGTHYPLVSRALWVVGLAGLVCAHRFRLAERWGASIALAALALVVVYWGALALVHARALEQARALAQSMAEQRGERLVRLAAMPVLADPLQWRCIAETDRAMHRFDLSVSGRSDGALARDAVWFEKPKGDARHWVSRAVAEDPRAEIFLDFARFPATRVLRGCAEEVLVQFADLRFTEPGNSRGRGGFALEVPVPHVGPIEAQHAK